MYIDYSPVPNWPHTQSGKVMVFEACDKGTNPDKFIEMARSNGAVSRDGDGDEIFWVVFWDNPRRVWDFTERTLRAEFKQPAA